MGWGSFFSNPISAVTNAVSNVVSGAGDVVSNAVNTIGNVGQSLIDTVKEHPLEAAALVAGGYYFAPEIGAWVGSDGTALAGTADGVAAGTAATTEGNLVAESALGQHAAQAGSEALAASANDPYALSAINGGSTGTGLTATGTEGLTAGGTTNLSSMGGAQGLTGATTAGTAAGAEGGTLAAGGLGSSLGLSNAVGAAGGSAASSSLASMLPYMAGAQIGTGLLQANAAKQAADIQSAAAQNATALQGQMFNTISQQQAPYRAAGYGALNQIGNLGAGNYVQYDASGNPTGTGTGSGYLTHQFDKNDLTNGLSPNYDFMLSQGQMANQRAANAGGGALGGNALQGLNKYTQDYAGNAYQNAFTNYQNQRSNIYNTLAGIAGIGQTGQTATNTAAQNATNAATQLGIGSAAAQAAGTTGVANSLGNTANNVVNNYTLASLLNQSGRVA
jgi:hypothetical protein